MKKFKLKKILLFSSISTTALIPVMAASCGTTNKTINLNVQFKLAIEKVHSDFTKQTLTFKNYINNSANIDNLKKISAGLLFSSSKDPSADLITKITNNINSSKEFYYQASNWTNDNKTTFISDIANNTNTFLLMILMAGYFYYYDKDASSTALKDLNFIDKSSDVYLFYNLLAQQNLVSSYYIKFFYFTLRDLFKNENNSTSFLVPLFKGYIASLVTFDIPRVTAQQNYPSANSKNQFQFGFLINMIGTNYRIIFNNQNPADTKFSLNDIIINGSNPSTSTFKFNSNYTQSITTLNRNYTSWLPNAGQGANFQKYLESAQGENDTTAAIHDLIPTTKNSDGSDHLPAMVQDTITKNNIFPTGASSWSANQKKEFATELTSIIRKGVLMPIITTGFMYTNHLTETQNYIGKADDNYSIIWNSYTNYLKQNSIWSDNTQNNFFNLDTSTDYCFHNKISTAASDADQTKSICYAMFTYDWQSNFAINADKITQKPSTSGFPYQFTISANGKTITFNAEVYSNANGDIKLHQLNFSKLYN